MSPATHFASGEPAASGGSLHAGMQGMADWPAAGGNGTNKANCQVLKGWEGWTDPMD